MADNRKRFIIELVVAGSAVIISLCALVVSYSQVKMMEEQMHLSVTPRLTIGTSISPNLGDFSIGVMNNGIGPAEIVNTEIMVDSVIVQNWEDFFYQLDSTKAQPETSTSKLNDVLLGQQQYKNFISFKDTSWCNYFNTERYRISIKVCYKSLFNDWFEVERKTLGLSGSVVTRKVEGNTIDNKKAFLVRLK